ncbi:hypothetical protein [Sulfitobacter sp. R18_1]|uniref:hypothetical protein n=1 Tax=Sulfitobacter sp. R18_1 TaxID=2821104 RepID=UPI001ADBB772|nr:hypothetical protein [Sulfitobacter sp. R18_1]MBO9428105.1 hypothetical protein [Sulfitobacter sp. R18_1]
MTTESYAKKSPMMALMDGEPTSSTMGSLAIGLTTSVAGAALTAWMAKGMMVANGAESWSSDPGMATLATSLMAVATIGSAVTAAMGSQCVFTIAKKKWAAISEWVEDRNEQRKFDKAQPKFNKGNQAIVSGKDFGGDTDSQAYFVGTIGKDNFRQVTKEEAMEFKSKHKDSGKLIEISEGVAGMVSIKNDAGSKVVHLHDINQKFPKVAKAYRSACDEEVKAARERMKSNDNSGYQM